MRTLHDPAHPWHLWRRSYAPLSFPRDSYSSSVAARTGTVCPAWSSCLTQLEVGAKFLYGALIMRFQASVAMPRSLRSAMDPMASVRTQYRSTLALRLRSRTCSDFMSWWSSYIRRVMSPRLSQNTHRKKRSPANSGQGAIIKAAATPKSFFNLFLPLLPSPVPPSYLR